MCQNNDKGLPEQYVMDAAKGINDSEIFLFMRLRVPSTPLMGTDDRIAIINNSIL